MHARCGCFDEKSGHTEYFVSQFLTGDGSVLEYT